MSGATRRKEAKMSEYILDPDFAEHLMKEAAEAAINEARHEGAVLSWQERGALIDALRFLVGAASVVVGRCDGLWSVEVDSTEERALDALRLRRFLTENSAYRWVLAGCP